jgi:hypothetical protein
MNSLKCSRASGFIMSASQANVWQRPVGARGFFSLVLLVISTMLFLQGNLMNSEAATERLRTTAAEQDAFARQVQLLQEQIQEQHIIISRLTATGNDSGAEKEDDDPAQGAFPHRLTCPGDPLPGKPGVDYSIALAYHVGMVKNWKTGSTDYPERVWIGSCGI